MMGKMEIELPDMYMMNRFMGICGNPKVISRSSSWGSTYVLQGSQGEVPGFLDYQALVAHHLALVHQGRRIVAQWRGNISVFAAEGKRMG